MPEQPPAGVASLDVTGEFDQIGRHYDRLTGMSPGYRRQLRCSAAALIASVTGPDGCARPSGRRLRFADLGCGSGASTRALVDELTAAGLPFAIDAIDASAGMLQAARAKPWPSGVSFRQLRAEELVADGVRYDGILAAYLLRNVPDGRRDALLTTLRESLVPGGALVLHDYCVRGRFRDELAWTALNWGAIIPSAVVVTRRPALFTYLWRSVLAFDSQEQLMDRLVRARYDDVRARGVPGWQSGLVRIVHGRRPR